MNTILNYIELFLQSKNLNRNILLLFIPLALLSGMVFFYPGFYSAPDVHYHFSRIQEIAQAMKEGCFSLKVISTAGNGYGSGSEFFYPHLFLFVPSGLYLLGFSIIVSMKIFLFFWILTIMYVTYFCAYKIIKTPSTALIITLLYTWTSLFAMGLSFGFMLGMILSYIAMPFIILGLYKIIYEDSRDWIYYTVGFACLIHTHLLTCMLMTIICFLYMLFNIRRIFTPSPEKVLASFTCVNICTFTRGFICFSNV